MLSLLTPDTSQVPYGRLNKTDALGCNTRCMSPHPTLYGFNFHFSDVILRLFHVAMHTSPEWALHALADDSSNKTTKRFDLTKIHGPNEWVSLERQECSTASSWHVARHWEMGWGAIVCHDSHVLFRTCLCISAFCLDRESC